MRKAHEISTEELCAKIPNKFQMVLVASLRAREMQKNKIPLPIGKSLNEIIEGKVDIKLLDKLRDKK
jgi:DNA-directed RNA polymerase omega subunit